MSQDLDSPYDLSRLEICARPLKLRHARVIASTNDWARQEVESGLIQAPALLIADSQSAGKGRGTNTWWSAIGNMAATFVMSQNPHIPLGLTPLLAGLAVRRALVRLTACTEIGLKWPNDLVVGPRKLAGLLCERLPQVDLIGVGVNVNAGSSQAPTDLRQRILSLSDLTGNVWELTDVVGEICHDMSDMLSLDSEAVARERLQEYSQHHWPTGKSIELIDTDRTPRIAGRCLGIDAQGRLLVKTEEGNQSFLTGTIASVSSATDAV